MNDQTKFKISYTLRSRKKSATHIHRIAESLRGKKKTDKHRKAISESMKNSWEQRKSHHL